MIYVFLLIATVLGNSAWAIKADSLEIVSIKGDCFIDRASQKIKITILTRSVLINDHLFCHRNSGIKMVIRNQHFLTAYNDLDVLVTREKDSINYKLYLGQIIITQPEPNDYIVETPSTRIDSTALWAKFESNKTADLEVKLVPHASKSSRITFFDNRGVVHDSKTLSSNVQVKRKEYSNTIDQQAYPPSKQILDIKESEMQFLEGETIDQSRFHPKNLILRDNFTGLQLEDHLVPEPFSLQKTLEDPKFAKSYHETLLNKSLFSRQISRFGQDTLLLRKNQSALISTPWLNYHAPSANF